MSDASMVMCNVGVQWTQIKDEVLGEIEALLSSGKYILGEKITAFEQKFTEFCNAKHCVGVANSTDTLVIAMRALAINRGYPIWWSAITTPLTFVATANAILRAGGHLELADVDAYGQLSGESVARNITSTTAIAVPVHLYGATSNLANIQELTRRPWQPNIATPNVDIVEDCAQAHGASVQGKKAGTIGAAGTFSFFPTKPLGCCGDGGAIITDNHELYETMLALRGQGGRDKNDVKHIGGLNSRLDAVQAVILSAKLKRLPDWQARRLHTAKLYDELLESTTAHERGLIRRIGARPNSDHALHQYVVVANARDQLQAHLKANGVPTQIHYPKLISQHTAYKRQFAERRFPMAEHLVAQILSLPFYAYMPDSVAETVVGEIERFYSAA